MRLQLKIIINFNTTTSYLKIWWLHITTHLSCKEVKFCKKNSEITVRMSCCAHFCNELPPNVKTLQKRAKYKQQRVASAAQAWLIYKPRPVLLYVHVCFLFNIISAKRCANLHFFDMLGHRNATCHLSPLVFDGKGDDYQPAGAKLQRKKQTKGLILIFDAISEHEPACMFRQTNLNLYHLNFFFKKNIYIIKKNYKNYNP